MGGLPPPSWAVDPASASARELEPGLWRLRLPVPWPHISHVNVYAIRHPDSGIVLVDCGGGGHPSALGALVAGLAASGHSLSDVRELVLTHYHTDHMGASGAVKAASGATVWAHRRADAFLDVVEDPERVEGERREMALAGGARGELLEALACVREELEGADDPVRPDRFLEDGTTLATALGPWTVVELPGHCPSQIGLWHAERAILISADAMTPVFSSFCDAGVSPDPIGEYRTSIERISGLRPRVALLGHGRPVTEVARLVDRYRAGFAGRLAAFEAALGREPQSTVAVGAAALGPYESITTAVWGFSEAHCYLTHLALHDRAVVEHTDARVTRWARGAARLPQPAPS